MVSWEPNEHLILLCVVDNEFQVTVMYPFRGIRLLRSTYSAVKQFRESSCYKILNGIRRGEEKGQQIVMIVLIR